MRRRIANAGVRRFNDKLRRYRDGSAALAHANRGRTFRRLLSEASVRRTRTRRPPRDRSRRERMPREGQLLQVDGSKVSLVRTGPAVRDAGRRDRRCDRLVTGVTFRAQEDAVGYFLTFAQTAERHGLPGAVYSNRHGIFIVEQNRALTHH